MFTCSNTHSQLTISDDGLCVALLDKDRQCTWVLAEEDRGLYTSLLDSVKGMIQLAPGTVLSLDEGGFETRHSFQDATIVFQWLLQDDHVAVTLRVEGNAVDIGAITLPGIFRSATGQYEIIVPRYQGLLIAPSGTLWSNDNWRGGHGSLSMGMGGLLGAQGGLLLTPDALTNWGVTYGEDIRGPLFYFKSQPCPVQGWQAMTMRICPTDNTVTSLAKRYRVFAQQRGQWKSWQVKIAAKPILQSLFGAVMTFIGYVQNDEIDYVANVQALRDYGFDSIYIYPVRFAHWKQDFTMAGGRKPIWLNDETLTALKAIDGVQLAPWTWVDEGIDDGSPAMHDVFRHTKEGVSKGWEMDKQKWVHVCTPYQREFIKGRLQGDMREMGWLHFDVNATHSGRACWSTEHALHGHLPMCPSEDLAAISELFSPATVGNRVVSSEGFNDAHTASYDIGSTKLLPNEASERCVTLVPLTMLVYHDCCIQDWWEMHSYNTNPCWKIGSPYTDSEYALGLTGAGEPHLKAALDALHGLPPNIFPFGTQYGWVTHLGDTYPMTQTLDNPTVQEALSAALPVARLHKEIGQLELVNFEMLSEDRYLQRTTFADGTQIIANLSSQAKEVTGIGVMEGKSWRKLR